MKRARGKRQLRTYCIESYSPADTAQKTMAQGVEKPTIRSRHTSMSVRSDAGGDSASESGTVASKKVDPLNSYSLRVF